MLSHCSDNSLSILRPKFRTINLIRPFNTFDCGFYCVVSQHSLIDIGIYGNSHCLLKQILFLLLVQFRGMNSLLPLLLPLPSFLLHLPTPPPTFFGVLLFVQFCRSVISDSLRLPGLQRTRLPCRHQLPGRTQTHVHRVGDAIQPSRLIPFSSCLQSFPASGSFPVSQLFESGDQSIGVSAFSSVLPMNIQD